MFIDIGKNKSPNDYLMVNEWNATHGPFYHVRQADVVWNLTEQDLVQYRIIPILGIPTLVATATPRGLKAGIADNLWVSLWGRLSNGRETEFASACLRQAQDLKKARCTFGGDEFHFLPGIPLTDNALLDATKNLGFSGSEVFDLVGDLDSSAVQNIVSDAKKRASANGLTFRPVETADQLARLQAFLLKEFPGRWSRELMEFQSLLNTQRAEWSILSKSQEILGFSRIALRGRCPLDKGWTPGALRHPLYEKESSFFLTSDSCLGPIGIAASARGHGLGQNLLGLVLNTLISQSAQRVCIDWTNAVKYYEPLQFACVRKYWTASKAVAD